VGVRRSGEVASFGGTNSMLWFRLERGENGLKHCRKMKRRQQGRLYSMGR
jgi:hypothetical protein